MKESILLPAEAGAFSVLVPILDTKGKIIDLFPSPVLAWVIADTGVVGVITPTKICPGGCAIWTPEGYVEAEDGDWPSQEAYIKHLQKAQARAAH